MVGTVFTAFFGAGITNVSTQLANCIRMLAFEAHKLSCCPANGSTFHIQLMHLAMSFTFSSFKQADAHDHKPLRIEGMRRYIFDKLDSYALFIAL
jgi:hypothetical protein